MKKIIAILLLCALKCHAFNFPYRTNIVYVAVTAYNAAAEESGYSNELVITNWMGGTKKFDQFALLTWDLETDPEVVGYKVYIGPASRQYNHSYDAGDTNTFDLPLFWNPPRHETVTYTYPGTGLLKAESLEGPWTPVSNPYSVTDYVGPNFFIRGVDTTQSFTVNKTITWN